MPRRAVVAATPYGAKMVKSGSPSRASPPRTPATGLRPGEEKPKLELFELPDIDDEDPLLRELRQASENAAKCLQRCWNRRPRWSPSYALDMLLEELGRRPLSAHDVSRAERRRLTKLGLRVPTSLAYSETPVDMFVGLLGVVASLREAATDGVVAEGSVRGRLQGTFYDLGCGTGLLCHTAALFHDFDKVVGFEILAGLFDEAVALDAYFKLRVAGRLMRRPDKPPAETKFVVGDALGLAWGTGVNAPTVVYCHSTCFDAELMGKLAARLAALPPSTFIVTTTFPVPAAVSPSGDETVRFAVLERYVMTLPFGPITAFIQQRQMTAQEEYDYGKL